MSLLSKIDWLRRPLLAAGISAATMLAVGGAMAPAQAQYYGYPSYGGYGGYCNPYYSPYGCGYGYPYAYGYGYPYYPAAWWGGGWGWGGGRFGGCRPSRCQCPGPR